MVPTRGTYTGGKLVARETIRSIVLFLKKKKVSSKRLVKIELEIKVKS